MSKIGNLQVLRSLGKLLQIEDVRQAPSELDTSSVKVTVDLGGGGFSGRSFGYNNFNDLNYAGNNSVIQQLINPNPLETSALLNPTIDARVLGASLRIEFDAAGSLAFNGKLLRVDLALIPSIDASTTVIVSSTVFTITTGNLLYTVTMGNSSWNGFVPFGWSLQWQVDTVDGANFPNFTSGHSAIAALYKPIETALPW